jgi:hypothetical protein
VRAADFGDPLAEGALSIEVEAAAGFGNDAPIGVGVHLAGQQLFDVEGEELDAVGIDAAEVGGDEAGGGDFGFGARGSGAFEDGFAEMGEGFDGDCGHLISG